jgi:hypothetical protein
MAEQAAAAQGAVPIPTPTQIRAMPATSPKALCDALTAAGLTVSRGGRHWRVTAVAAFLGTVPFTPSDPHALRNCRSWLARRAEDLTTGGAR